MRTVKNWAYFLFCAFSCPFAANPSSAAPPTLTTLSPAGAQRGTTTEVSATGSFDSWPVKAWASGKGVTVAAAKDKGKLAVAVAADAAPGVYWLRAYTADGASNLRPFVVGILPEIAEVEPNDDPKKPQVLSAPAVVVNGRLAKPGDVDGFAVLLRKGQTLVAALDAHHTFRSPMDGVLQIVSADGFVLEQNNDFRGLDPQLAFTAPADGTYVARVFAFPAAPDTMIRLAGAEGYVYRLTLTTGGFVDYPVPLAVGRAGPATVEPHGWNIPADLRSLTVALPPAGESHAVLFHDKLANPFRVRVEPHPAVNLVGKPAPTTLAAPFSATGRIDTQGGETVIPFAAKKEQPLSVQVESRSLGLAVNPVVRVLDPAGKPLARAEPGKLHGDTALSFTPPADGTYTAAVADLYGGGGQRFAFLLRVVPPEPDYSLTVAAERFAVPPGKSLDIPVQVARANGFTKPVEIVAAGLPEGVKFEVKPPAGKADPNAVVVTLTADKAGAAGAFRLVGRVAGDPALTRTARAALPEFEETTADLWVTVSDSPASPPAPKKKK